MPELHVGGVPVAVYVTEPGVERRLAPRPYLHPVRTLAGTVVTAELPADHPWHLGVSVTMPDVDGANLWGGRTYVRDQGYVWRADHGQIVAGERQPVAGGFAEDLRWCGPDKNLLLREHRTIRAEAAPLGWELRFRYALSAPGPSPVTLGSPATNGRSGGAGYGGFFWRLAAGAARAFVSSGGEPHGSADAWLAVTVDDAYTLVFQGLAEEDRWFVRTDEYNGVCAALAYTDPLVIRPGNPLTRQIRVLIADGPLSAAEVAAAVPA
jgi:hypothetical protein